jgi:transcriptional regulator with XRE-family HTH domain
VQLEGMVPASAPVGSVDATREVERRRLGRAIRRRRKELALTLAQVADTAGISVSLLSQVERGQIDPSLDSLRSIAEAISTTPFHLLSDHTDRAAVIPNGQGRQVEVPQGRGRLEILTPWSDASFVVGRWALEPGGSTPDLSRARDGEEALYVVSGTASIEAGEEVHVAREGDFFTCDARLPHRLTAGDSEPVVFLCISWPPC